MITIDDESRGYFKEKLSQNQALRVFFGGYGWGGPSMGLALDEPKEGDETHQIDGLQVIADPFAMKLIKESGGLTIKSSMFGPTAELNRPGGGGCSCG